MYIARSRLSIADRALQIVTNFQSKGALIDCSNEGWVNRSTEGHEEIGLLFFRVAYTIHLNLRRLLDGGRTTKDE
jgi:hypothetical protein